MTASRSTRFSRRIRLMLSRAPDLPERKALHTRKRQYLSEYLQLGLEEAAMSELLELLQEETPYGEPWKWGRRRAADELVNWFSLSCSVTGSVESAEQCLKYAEIAVSLEPAPDARHSRKLSVIRAECLRVLGDFAGARECLAMSMQKEQHQDLFLARANMSDSESEALEWINKAFMLHNYSPLVLGSSPGNKPAIDRIQNIKTKSKPRCSEPLITVIMPAFNCADTIRTSLNAVLCQTWENLQILVVDDCSTDNTRDVIDQYVSMDDRVRSLVTPVNSGPYVARNLALAIAEGEYVTCHDADDWSHPQKLEVQATHLNDHLEAVANTSEQVRARPDLSMYRRSARGRYVFENFSSLMFRREMALEKLGFWDSVRFAADGEYIDRIKRRFGPRGLVHLKSGPLSFQRQTPASLTGDPQYGFHGFMFGARREYLEQYRVFHAQAENQDLRFPEIQESRKFPIVDPLQPVRDKSGEDFRHVDVVIVSDFRLEGPCGAANIGEIKEQRKLGMRVGLVQLATYNFGCGLDIAPGIRSMIDGEGLQYLVYGESVLADNVIILCTRSLQHAQHYVPRVRSDRIAIVIGEFDPLGEKRRKTPTTEYQTYQQRINDYFGAEERNTRIDWYPLNTSVRSRLRWNRGFKRSGLSLAATNWTSRER